MAGERETLLDDVRSLRQAVIAEADAIAARWSPGDGVAAGMMNLAHYLALRHHDIRPLQRRLMACGLSSLGRLESRVLPTLDAVCSALEGLTGVSQTRPCPTEAEFFAGELRLETAAEALLGPLPSHRRSRIMVTLPTEASSDPTLVLDLARKGMDIARINCAHDDHLVWREMAARVAEAGRELQRPVRVLMDIAGPKIRTNEVAQNDPMARVGTGDRIRLIASGPPRPTAEVPFSASVSVPDVVTRLAVGHRVRYNDGKLEGVVESLAANEAVVLVTRTKGSGARLRPEKGLNLPDTALGLSPLTSKDESDLATIVEYADIIGYSFVSRADDLDLLERTLDRLGTLTRPLGVVAKIELPEAVRNLPELIARATPRRPFGVMIARGDLAAEIGFERVAEMQEEILWICEAAGVPAVWATQVLEDLIQEGVPSRGEMTDAAMAARAECVMINKGPWAALAVETLDRMIARMDAHIFKKTPALRRLGSW